jgi:hypothetical protein
MLRLGCTVGGQGGLSSGSDSHMLRRRFSLGTANGDWEERCSMDRAWYQPYWSSIPRLESTRPFFQIATVEHSKLQSRLASYMTSTPSVLYIRRCLSDIARSQHIQLSQSHILHTKLLPSEYYTMLLPRALTSMRHVIHSPIHQVLVVRFVYTSLRA